MQRQAECIGRLEQMRGDALSKDSRARVHRDDPPAAVDRQAGVGLVGREHAVDALAHRGHLGVVERAFRVDRGEPSGQQQLILFAQWHVERVGEAQHHGPARRRPSRLDEADVARRHVGLECEVQLAEPSALSPLAHQRAERGGGGGGHHASVTQQRRRLHYLWGNCPGYVGAGR
jgi:hypothetical protein